MRILVTGSIATDYLMTFPGRIAEQILPSRIDCVSVVTHGPAGVRVDRAGREPVVVPAIPDVVAADPTGSGDAFRAGFLAGSAWGLSVERAAQLGCALASVVLESIGTQDYAIDPDNLLARLAYAYGAQAAEIGPYLAAR
jgi:adenosine kinase